MGKAGEQRPGKQPASRGDGVGGGSPVIAALKTFIRGYGRKVPVRDPRSVPPRQPSWQARPPVSDEPDRWWNQRRVVYPVLSLAFLGLAAIANARAPEPAPRPVAGASTPTASQPAVVAPQRLLPAAPAFTYTPPPTQAPYANCAEAIASGRAPIVLNEPGFSPALDVEGGNPEDGVACEGEPIKGMNLYDPVRYNNCSEVRDAGAAPIRAGDPGYSLDLDRDGDGIACEWS